MKKMIWVAIQILLIVFFPLMTFAKENSKDSLVNPVEIELPSQFQQKVHQRLNKLDGKIDASTRRALKSFQKQHEQITLKLFKIDSIVSRNLTVEFELKYTELSGKLEQTQSLTQYFPYLDTLKTSFKFLEKFGSNESFTKGIRNSADQLTSLESQLQKAQLAKDFLRDQQNSFRKQLQQFGMAKELKKINKEIYYYGQQINEYKEALKDTKKLERKAIELLSKTKLFQEFMQRNSMLSALFKLPYSENNEPELGQTLPGLQTRQEVTKLIQSQIGPGGQQAIQQIQANVQQTENVMNGLKSNLNKMGNDVSDGNMPDFKPNNQRKKSILKRLEYGTNIQTLRPTGFFPVTSDIGISIGYKMNDAGIFGIGASYRLGLGKDIQHIQISHQGAGIRSFLDYKLKKSLWLSAGFEMNYRSMFSSIEQLKNQNAWQRSGLLGVSQKLPFKTKLLKTTKIQVLWDFLSSYQVPKTQPIIFRIGYNF